jgi:uncharacterized membrane protein
MHQLIIAYALTLPVLLALDLLWLGVVMKKFYRSQLHHLLSGEVRRGVAAAFYVIFLAGLFYFAVAPAGPHHAWQTAAWLGAFYGFFTYATYDLSNMATLKEWPLKITLVDMAWGSVLGGILGTAGFFLLNFF